MIFTDEKTKKFNKAIKSKDLKNALICVSDNFETNYSQELRLFQLTDENKIFETLNELAQEGVIVSDKYLALSSIYYNSSYFWNIGAGTTRGIELNKYPFIAKVYEEKIEQNDFCRTLFLEWKRLFEKMINQSTTYQSQYNTATFYKSPHDYEEYVIETTAHNFLNIMFKQATKEELFKIMLDCKKYPKIPHASTEIDKLYNQQNSRYYDVQYLSKWLSENALPLINKNKEKLLPNSMSLVSQGIIEEIKLIYKDLIKNKHLLEPQDLMIVEKLYETRLPELLEEFDNFDHKNYGQLKHKNKNASDFLLGSLSEMHAMFEEFNQKVSLQKIENLSFNVKLTKEFIKHNF